MIRLDALNIMGAHAIPGKSGAGGLALWVLALCNMNKMHVYPVKVISAIIQE